MGGLDLDEILPFVRDLVVAQGRLALERWPSPGRTTFKDRRDVVTGVDLEIERNLKEALAQRFPGHGLSGEETGDENAGAEYCWLIDPIDGTKYYAGHSSLFAVSVALVERGEPVLGVVCNAASEQCFSARAGGGAHLDGVRLDGPDVAELADVIANVDTPGTPDLAPEERAWFESKLVELTRRIYRVRALGQGSLAACWVASGALDAYVDLTGYTKPQDLAAGRVIMKEAGLELEDLDPGVGPPRLLAAPPGVFESLKALLETGRTGPKMARALEEIALSDPPTQIKDPVEWQREIRRDRSLPGRDDQE